MDGPHAVGHLGNDKSAVWMRDTIVINCVFVKHICKNKKTTYEVLFHVGDEKVCLGGSWSVESRSLHLAFTCQSIHPSMGIISRLSNMSKSDRLRYI